MCVVIIIIVIIIIINHVYICTYQLVTLLCESDQYYCIKFCGYNIYNEWSNCIVQLSEASIWLNGENYEEDVLYLGRVCGSAFWRKALRKSLSVCAVVVYHVILLHPLEPLLACWVHLFGEPSIATWWGGRWSWTTRRCPRGPNTSTCIEVSIGSCERSLCPICLHKSTPCGPIISIPEAWVYLHGLVFWKWNANWLQVLELSNGSAIYR